MHRRPRSSPALCDFCTYVYFEGTLAQFQDLHSRGRVNTHDASACSADLNMTPAKTWETRGFCFLLDLSRPGSVHTVPFSFFLSFCYVSVTLQAALSLDSLSGLLCYLFTLPAQLRCLPPCVSFNTSSLLRHCPP